MRKMINGTGILIELKGVRSSWAGCQETKGNEAVATIPFVVLLIRGAI